MPERKTRMTINGIGHMGQHAEAKREESPETQNSEAGNPEIGTREIGTQEIGNSETENSEDRNPAAANSETESQKSRNPTAGHPAVRVTTLCHLEQDGKYLMLHRISKSVDENKDKWIGVGGHVEEGESPEDCLIREVKEETGLTLTSYRFRGLVTFVSDQWGTEYMCLYTADRWTGELTGCREGTLEWVDKDKVTSLQIWEGDKIFFRLLEEEAPFFSLKLRYEGDRLMEAVLDGNILEHN